MVGKWLEGALKLIATPFRHLINKEAERLKIEYERSQNDAGKNDKAVLL